MDTAPRDTLRRVTVTDLEAFVAVAELGTFSAAALRLHVSQPSVTNRVRRLEATLKTQLLVRTTRTVAVTAAGRVVLERGVPAMNLLDGILREVVDAAAEEQSAIVVASTPLTASILLPRLVRAYTDHHPGRHVHILDLNYPEILDALQNGKAHVAFLTEPADDRFMVETIWRDDVVLVAPPDHSLAGRETIPVEALVDQELLLMDLYAPLLDSVVSAMNASQLRPPRAHLVHSMSTVLGMFEAGMGVAMMTRTTADLRTGPGASPMKLDGFALQRVYSLVIPRKPARAALVRDFGDHLRASFRD
ncbi:MAG: LysR family transcriptional regulator [Mycobacterium sp.]